MWSLRIKKKHSEKFIPSRLKKKNNGVTLKLLSNAKYFGSILDQSLNRGGSHKKSLIGNSWGFCPQAGLRQIEFHSDCKKAPFEIPELMKLCLAPDIAI